MLHNKSIRYCIAGILIILCNAIIAQDPLVQNVRFEQRTDGSLLVDIFYDLTTAGGIPLEIIVEASDDDGASWDLPCTSLDGDVGEEIFAGVNKHVVWDFNADNPDTSGFDYRIRVTANLHICGQTITEDLILTRDIICPCLQEYQTALTVGASNVTLDLGGYTLASEEYCFGSTAIVIAMVDGITVKNGTIDAGFSKAIGIYDSDSTTIEDLTVRNLEFSDPDTFIMGIAADGSHDILIQDCRFEYLPVFHKECVLMGNNTTFTVDNIEVLGGSAGVNISGYEIPSYGIVKNSRFLDVCLAGVLVHASDSAIITNNYFSENGMALQTDPVYYRSVSGLKIHGNEIRGGGNGIYFEASVNADIYNNTITDVFYWGIAMDHLGCEDGEPEENCWISTGNVIRDNIVLGTGIDLYHHEKCLGNTWENNTFNHAEGIEIFSAPPATAHEFLSLVDSAASSVATDAQLVVVTSLSCDTLGKSYKWKYYYRSEIHQDYYEFWFHDGRVIQRDSAQMPCQTCDDFLPFDESWIDSDSAMVIAEGMGGKDFREVFELESIGMGLAKRPTFTWGIDYRARDTVFTATVDAALK